MTTKKPDSTIVFNRKAGFEYFLETQYEAGLSLEGWEVKSLRAGKVNISDAHIIIKNGEAFLLAAQINPLQTASTHIIADPLRTRKLLLNRKELNSLIGGVERQGYTIVPISMYWKKSKIKIKIALAKGKREHDKRDTVKNREWQRDHSRLMKNK